MLRHNLNINVVELARYQQLEQRIDPVAAEPALIELHVAVAAITVVVGAAMIVAATVVAVGVAKA